jgi:hypothetical protein
MFRCSPRRDNPDALAPLDIRDRQYLTMGHAKQDAPLLAVRLAFVGPLDGKRVVEGEGGPLETQAMIAKIFGCLVVIPLEILVMDNLRDTRIFCKTLV